MKRRKISLYPTVTGRDADRRCRMIPVMNGQDSNIDFTQDTFFGQDNAHTRALRREDCVLVLPKAARCSVGFSQPGDFQVR